MRTPSLLLRGAGEWVWCPLQKYSLCRGCRYSAGHAVRAALLPPMYTSTNCSYAECKERALPWLSSTMGAYTLTWELTWAQKHQRLFLSLLELTGFYLHLFCKYTLACWLLIVGPHLIWCYSHFSECLMKGGTQNCHVLLSHLAWWRMEFSSSWRHGSRSWCHHHLGSSTSGTVQKAASLLGHFHLKRPKLWLPERKTVFSDGSG